MSRLLVVLVGAAVLLLPAPTATAHNDLVATSPEQGSRLAALPASVVLVFDGPLAGPAQVAVRGPDGASRPGLPSVDGSTLEVPLDSRGAGSYEVFYRVTGADGHPVSGSLEFSAAAGGVAPRAGPAPTASGPRAPAAAGAWWWLLLLPLVLISLRARRGPAVIRTRDHRP